MMTAPMTKNMNKLYTGIGLVDVMKARHCKHKYRTTERSNVLQLDDLGYPLRLYIETCTKCGEGRQQWIDVPVKEMEELDDGSSVLLRWERVI